MPVFKYRSAILVAVDLFILFLILPFIAGLRAELDDFREAKANPRAAAEPKIVYVEAPAEEDSSTRRDREIVSPEVTSKPELNVEDFETEDPFIGEARRLALEDPEAAMLWVQAQANGPERLRGMLEVVAIWAADDSQAALIWLESNAQGLARMETLYSGMDLWSQQDPTAASEWILGMANDGSKSTASRALVANWVKEDATAASTWVNEIEPGTLRSETASALVGSWLESDPESATIWAMAEAEFHGDQELMTMAIAGYTDNDPERAETFLRNTSGAADTPGAVESYVEAFAKRDPEEAARWYESLPDFDLLYDPDHAEILLREWSRTDSVAASGWLNDIPNGSERDSAISGFTSTLIEFEPAAAVAWSNEISDPNKRTETLKNSIVAWSKRSPNEAREWLNSSNITPALRRSITSEIEAQ